MTPSEKYVSELCEKSFLPFWSFPNPIGKKNKELCDVFVVCENHIIIISVKDISLSEHNDESVKYERWLKKAIYDSSDQIHGAERFLETVDEVLSQDGNTKIDLPSKDARIIHRIAIAFGSRSNYPIPTGDFGKGFIHVFDEASTFTVLDELDTITDFTNYLVAKEKFIADKSILIPTESDFLALYLQTGLEIEAPADTIISDAGLWDQYVLSKEYSEWQRLIKISYVWDNIILRVHNYHVTKGISNERRRELEESVRQINLEPRINRIELGSILDNAKKQKVTARMTQPLPGYNHAYVLIPLNDENWERKESELKLRCIVARVLNPMAQKIIGIAIGSNSNGENHFDICYLDIPELTDDVVEHSRTIQNEFGFFRNPTISHSKDFRDT